jgi:predicted PurR-regulated permease PerM
MQSVLIPFVIAGLVFYALDPAVDWLQKRRIPRAIGGGVLLLAVVAGCAALAYSFQGQALTLTSAVVAVVTGGALWMMGLQQAALWGLLAGIFNSIPYYGPLLVRQACRS